ncbi:hypothetical protein AV530_002404 [Patagioenas fasciata monilis]|uniref:Uncharacterized protein n=1 Tax=Patagioenas fasciata monilis TaxID=372326 RepID=A0A1V4K6F1_PATFA|nr:hypothetical protein AV530_002404 [Patagioenas fasciata monilis]
MDVKYLELCPRTIITTHAQIILEFKEDLLLSHPKDCRGLPLPFLFRTIPREKNYIIGQIQVMQKENGKLSLCKSNEGLRPKVLHTMQLSDLMFKNQSDLLILQRMLRRPGISSAERWKEWSSWRKQGAMTHHYLLIFSKKRRNGATPEIFCVAGVHLLLYLMCQLSDQSFILYYTTVIVRRFMGFSWPQSAQAVTLEMDPGEVLNHLHLARKLNNEVAHYKERRNITNNPSPCLFDITLGRKQLIKTFNSESYIPRIRILDT